MIKYDPERTCPNWSPGSWEYLEGLLLPNAIVFEYGSGQSTLWLAQRLPEGKVYSVEHDPVWIARVRKLTEDYDNVCLMEHRIDEPTYVNSSHGLFNRPEVYIIDGYQRPECLRFLMRTIRDGDIMVCDDAGDYLHACPLRIGDGEKLHTFSTPHPYAGKKITRPRGNSLLTHHAPTKDTVIWRV